MSDFLHAALPWIAIAMVVAVAMTYMDAGKVKKK